MGFISRYAKLRCGQERHITELSSVNKPHKLGTVKKIHNLLTHQALYLILLNVSCSFS